MSPFDMIMLPDTALPAIHLPISNQTNFTKYDEAGFKVKKSMFIELILAG